MHADPLSDALSLLTPSTCVAGGFDLGGDWAIQFKKHNGLKYFALGVGRAWLHVEGERTAILLEAGDCVVLPSERSFRMARDLENKPTHIDQIPASEWRDGIATVRGGGDTMLLGGHFAFSGLQMSLLLGPAAPILQLRDDRDTTSLRWALERLQAELTAALPGGSSMVQHLAHLLLVQALRLYLTRGAGRTVGWLFALGDPKIGKAARAIHAAPAERWTLTQLAGIAGMSRSKFALRFKTITGTAPIDYLTQWRMILAGQRLMRGREPIAVIASSLGYGSEAAFSTAFKREMGRTPRRYASDPT